MNIVRIRTFVNPSNDPHIRHCSSAEKSGYGSAGIEAGISHNDLFSLHRYIDGSRETA